MKRMILLTGTFVLAIGLQIGTAAAQLATPQNCNEFDMVDQSNNAAGAQHTPMILLACENGLFMEYGPASGSHAGQGYLASTFDATNNTLAGTVVEYDDGTGCGPISFNVNGELVDGQYLYLTGFRPIRVPVNQQNGCMITGEYQQVDRQFALAQQPAANNPPPPPSNSGSSASSGGSSGNCVNVPGALAGGALGGFVGNQFGSGSGNTAATAGGAALGAVIGSRAGCP